MLQNIIIWAVSYWVLPYATFLSSGTRTLISISAPFVVPRLIAFVQSILAPPAARRVPIRPAPLKVARALNILFASAACALMLTLPYFSVENIFAKTQSRLKIPVDVLFTRLAGLRNLTATDELLRDKFQNTESRLLYAVYGPDTVAHCTICIGDDKGTALAYFLYHLPKLLAPHLLHATILGLVTSSVITGPEGARWRTHTWIAAMSLAVLEIWYIGTYPVQRNKATKTPDDIDFVYWRVRLWRQLAIAFFDVLLAGVLWLTSTNRWLARPPSVAARIEDATKNVEDSLNKMRALGVLRNALVRDRSLRGEVEAYWSHEGQVMGELVQEAEVAAEINKVVERVNMEEVEARAAQMADGIVSGLDGLGERRTAFA